MDIKRVWAEREVGVPASEAWKFYGGLQFSKFIVKELPEIAHKIDVIEGDGGVGTVLKVTFPPGYPDPFSSNYIEKFVVVDDEKRVKVAKGVQGWVLDHGFTFIQTRFDVIEKDETTCITKVTYEYKVKDEAAANILSSQCIPTTVTIMEVVANYLITQAQSSSA